MDFLIFICLLPCTLLISVILITPIINCIEYISNKIFNKEIDFLDWHYITLIFILWVLLMYIFYNYFIYLDVNYPNINT